MKESRVRRIAVRLAEGAGAIAPVEQRAWAAAMRNEMDYVANDREALGWAAGSLRAAMTERLRTVQVPDGPGVRMLLVLVLLVLVFNDVFATALTAAYRLGFLPVARGLGELTPGDDYARLIPLMENIPLWLHALKAAGAALYAFTILRLAGRGRVSWVPVALAIGFEIAATVLGEPVIERIGVRADPNPSMIALALPFVVPLGLALYLWRMRRPAPAREAGKA